MKEASVMKYGECVKGLFPPLSFSLFLSLLHQLILFRLFLKMNITTNNLEQTTENCL